MGGHGVKPDGQIVHVLPGVVGLEDGIGHGALLRLLRRGQARRRAVPGRDEGTVLVVHTLIVNGQHGDPLRCHWFSLF